MVHPLAWRWFHQRAFCPWKRRPLCFLCTDHTFSEMSRSWHGISVCLSQRPDLYPVCLVQCLWTQHVSVHGVSSHKLSGFLLLMYLCSYFSWAPSRCKLMILTLCIVPRDQRTKSQGFIPGVTERRNSFPSRRFLGWSNLLAILFRERKGKQDHGGMWVGLWKVCLPPGLRAVSLLQPRARKRSLGSTIIQPYLTISLSLGRP